jgi:hypothetical protein
MGTIFDRVRSFRIVPPLAETDPGSRWLAWTCDAIDFFNVALSVTRLQQQFHKAEAASIVRHN